MFGFLDFLLFVYAVILHNVDVVEYTDGENVPWTINRADVNPTITHVISHPRIVFIKMRQLIPEQFLVFSSKPTPTVPPT